MTDLRLLEQKLLENLPWNRARIKFVTRFLLALYSQRTVNLAKLATAFSGHASEASNYKRLQRFLHSFALPDAQVARFVVKLLGVAGPYTLALSSHELENRDGGDQHFAALYGLARHRLSARVVCFAARGKLRYERAHHPADDLY